MKLIKMRIGFLKILYITVLNFLFLSAESQLVYSNFHKAYNIISKADSVLNYGLCEDNYILGWKKGNFFLKGHFNKPYQYSIYKLDGYISFAKDITVMDSFTLRNNNRIYINKITYSKKGSLIIENNDTLINTKIQIQSSIYKSAEIFPGLLLKLILQYPNNLTFIEGDKDWNTKEVIVKWTNLDGIGIMLFFDLKTFRLKRLERLSYDNVLGDVVTTISYLNYKQVGKCTVPHNVVVREADSITMEINFDWFVIQKKHINGDQPMSTSLFKLSDNLYEISFNDLKSKVLVCDLDDYLIIFDPPTGVKYGNLIIGTIQKEFPQKLIKYCVISHHHPDHLGGVRPFIQTGVTIITTKGNVNLIKKIALNSHLLNYYNGYKSPIDQVKFKLVDTAKFIIANKDYFIRIYLFSNSKHTDEYLLTYFNKEKLLLEGDLCNFSNLSPDKKASIREIALYEFVKKKNLEILHIFQSWNAKELGNSLIPFTFLERVCNNK